MAITPRGGDPRVEQEMVEQTLDLENTWNLGNWLGWQAPETQANARACR